MRQTNRHALITSRSIKISETNDIQHHRGRFDRAHDTFFSFGPFCLYPYQRVLEHSGAPVNIGGRALDLLIALVQRPGEICSTTDLMQAVWPFVTVGEATLRMHVTGLRRALGPTRKRYITNVPGRGYCFVGAVSKSRQASSKNPSLPELTDRLFGRDDVVQHIITDLERSELVTLVGEAGIGKTSVAISICRQLEEKYDGLIVFVDLGSITNEALLATSVLGAVGLSSFDGPPIEVLTSFAQGKPMLLVFDNCEHLIQAAASMADGILSKSNDVKILATSREALRIRGERVYRLSSLLFPPVGASLTANEAQAFPAVQLFIDRMSANLNDFQLDDSDVQIVGRLCAKLDGIPLAIEIAAGRAFALGVHQTAALLDDRLDLAWPGRRTALPRQRTLNSALDWSYNLLSDSEQRILRCLSVFVGSFSLEAAQAVVAMSAVEIANGIASLVAKSLISPATARSDGRLRLLQITKAYAQNKLMDDGGFDQVSLHHSQYFCDLLEDINKRLPDLLLAESITLLGEDVGNIRSALEWSFSEGENKNIAVRLCAQAGSALIAMSLLDECRSWMLRACEDSKSGEDQGRATMRICAALGVSSLFTRGASSEARQALENTLDLALTLNEPVYVLGALGMLNIFFQRVGDYDAALEVAHRGAAFAHILGDPNAIVVAQWTVGVSHHLIGDHARAQTDCEAALQPWSRSVGGEYFKFLGYDHRVRAMVVETLSLWHRGFPDRAVQAAELLVQDSALLGQPVPGCVAYLTASAVLYWVGDKSAADTMADRATRTADKYSLLPFRAAAVGMKSANHLDETVINEALPILRQVLATLYREKYVNLAAGLAGALAGGLASIGQHKRARETIDTALSLSTTRGDFLSIPDLWQVKGEIISQEPGFDVGEAEKCFLSSIDWSQRQSALSWELRAATSLCRLWSAVGRREEGKRLLRSVYDQFTEGFGTSDLRKAKRQLDALA